MWRFISGALGMEMVASLVFDRFGSEELGVATMAHTIPQSIDEFCEMLGIVIFLYALMDYLATHFPVSEVRIQNID